MIWQAFALFRISPVCMLHLRLLNRFPVQYCAQRLACEASPMPFMSTTHASLPVAQWCSRVLPLRSIVSLRSFAPQRPYGVSEQVQSIVSAGRISTVVAAASSATAQTGAGGEIGLNALKSKVCTGASTSEELSTGFKLRQDR